MSILRSAFQLVIWFALRAALVITLLLGVFYGVEFFSGAADNGMFNGEAGQLLAYVLWLGAAAVGVWFLFAVVRFFVSATNGFRAGLKGEDTK